MSKRLSTLLIELVNETIESTCKDIGKGLPKDKIIQCAMNRTYRTRQEIIDKFHVKYHYSETPSQD